jgi:mRNA interferase MazF
MMTMTQPKPNFKRGDIVLVLFPNSDLTTAKTRPAIIVQSDNLQTGLPQIIIAMISSQMFRAEHPSRITILRNSPEGQQSGLLVDFVIMTDSLATIATSAIYRLIGSIPSQNVDTALKYTLNLN